MFSVIAFYKFVNLSPERVSEVRSFLEDFAAKSDLQGLVILGKEGINSTLAASDSTIQNFKTALKAQSEFEDVQFKNSSSEESPFKRFKIKERREIVTLKNEDHFADSRNNHISPEEWDKMMEDEDVVLIDTRNDYEYEVGTFEGAINPDIQMFSEFPDYLENSGIPKNKKVMIFCTGGIRCEKAIYEMQDQGYEQVYQLDGGILKYLEEKPNQKFKGDCFVFDNRVALNQELKPSDNIHLCAHCGDPGALVVDCEECGKLAKICHRCAPQPEFNTCSKNCAHHYLRKRAAVSNDSTGGNNDIS